MTKEKKESTPKKHSKDQEEEVKEITLVYKLHELPSSQHKAGLAGLVLMVRWLTERNPQKVKGILDEIECTKNTYKLRIDKDGMRSLFDETYSASWAEQERDKVLKNPRTKAEIPYKRKDKKIVESLDKKTGERVEKEKEVFIYDVVLPSGAFLVDMDSSESSAWVKLWRDMVWNILRGIPTTRIVYENRASKEENKDYLIAWNSLVKNSSKKSEVQGTYFLGSQDKNAEGVPFLDSNKNFLLLHFWPFISQIYIPQKLEYDNSTKKYKQSDDGFTLCIPEILELNNFCLDYEEFLRLRDNSMFGYRPKTSRINILEEAGWDSFERFKRCLIKLEGSKQYSDLLSGIDIFRFIKDGNNINNKASFRIKPDNYILKEYEAFKNDNYFDPIFKRQVLINLSKNRFWYIDFDKLFKISGYEHFIGKGQFASDVSKKFFRIMNINQKEKQNMENAIDADEALPSSENLKSLEQIIYWMIRNYISMKLASKYGFKKEEAKTGKYIEMKEKLSKETFLAIRSRTGEDFISYFSSSICSVGQYMNEERFLTLTKALFDETDKVRTLSMLALSAVSYTYQKKETTNV